MRVYMDNISGTALDDEVFKTMVPYLQNQHGIPYSLHLNGREAKKVIEKSRNKIAQYLNAEPGEIAFTSSGSEALKTAIISAIESTGIDHVITTRYEHSSVLEILLVLQRKRDLRISYVMHHNDGRIDLHHLEYLLRTNTRNVISVSHAYVETGNLNDIGRISALAEHYKALLHIDAVQTLGHYRYDMGKLKAHFLTASADKFYGPKGVGFLYSRNVSSFSKPAYDKDFENVSNAAGLAKALEIGYRDLYKRKEYIEALKQKLTEYIRNGIPESSFIGNSALQDISHFAVLSVKFPNIKQNLLQYLDDYHISVSGTSENGFDVVHFSLSKYNTPEEIDYVFDKLSSIYTGATVLKVS